MKRISVLCSLCLLLAAWPVSGADCDNWNTKEFFTNTTPEAVADCLQAGANPNAQNKYNQTPLHWAARSNPAIITVLLNAGADLNARAIVGGTPLHWAAGRDDPTVIATLLDAGADVDARDTDGNTPLYWAATSNYGSKRPRPLNTAVIKVLLNAGADPNARNEDGVTPLHRAADFNTKPAVIMLLDAGADLDARDINGDTPLYEALTNFRNPAVFTVLLNAGADPKARNEAGVTPLHRAAGYQHNKARLHHVVGRWCRSQRKRQLGLHASASGSLVQRKSRGSHCAPASRGRSNARNEAGATPLHKAASSNKNPHVITTASGRRRRPQGPDEIRLHPFAFRGLGQQEPRRPYGAFECWG